MYQLLKDLIGIHAAPGREHKLANRIVELITPYVDEVYVDRIGSVIAKVNGVGENKKKILYSAHMDEVAMIVTYIEGNGYIRFTNNGYPNWASLTYREVEFESGVHGYVVPNAGADASLNPNAMYIDIGTRSKADTEKLVHVGECCAAISGVRKLHGSVIAGRPIDDRIGIAILIAAAREMSEKGEKPYHDIVYAFSVQEETDALPVGASVIGFEESPDIAIAVDVCGVGDVPGAPAQIMKLGGGAAIMIRDNRLICDGQLVDALTETAKENKIPYQYEISLAGGQDSVGFQKIGYGSRASCISIPMRYLHTSAEMSDMKDAEACEKLILAFNNKVLDF